MKHLYTSFAALFIAFTFIACDFISYKTKVSVNDSVVKEKQGTWGFSLHDNKQVSVSNYPYRNFSSITISGAVEVYYTQGANYSVRVEEEGEKRTIVELNGHQLNIRSKKRNNIRFIGNANRSKIFITSPHLDEIKISGASKFCSKTMNQSNMKVGVSGASKVDLGKIDCSQFNLSISGASKMSGDVKAQYATVDMSGASKADMSFIGKNILVENSGASKLTLDLDCEKLSANNSGASKLKVSGYVDDVDIKKSGASRVDQSDLNKD